MHVTPLSPQAASLVPGWQTLFSQHPLGQLAVVQTQDPLLHSVPGGHVVQVPPPEPQNSLDPPPLQVLVVVSQHPLEQLAAVHTHEPL